MKTLFVIDLMPFLYRGHFVFLRNPRMTATGLNTSALMGFANGVGANGSRTIGVCLVGGMLFGTLGLLLTVPGLFTIFQKIQERFKPMERKEELS